MNSERVKQTPAATSATTGEKQKGAAPEFTRSPRQEFSSENPLSINHPPSLVPAGSGAFKTLSSVRL